MGDEVSREGRGLVQNTVLNIIGQAVPLLVAVFSLPYTIHGLGPDRFGILSIAWVLVGYFSLFDLGLGRATTKFVAEAKIRGEDERISKIVWTSLVTQAILGVVVGAAFAIATPILAGRILKTSPQFLTEMRGVLYLLSGSIPVIVCARNLRGVLEAAQRFDLVNVVRVPSGMLTFLIPMAGAFMHLRVTTIVLFLILLVGATAVVYLAFGFRVFPAIAKAPSIDRAMVRPLIVFGGWVTVSNFLVPVLIYLDRFLIGVLVSVAALTYYTAPYEVASRLLIFPAALSTTLFPAFSALSALGRGDLVRLYIRSLKYIVLGLGPMAFVGVLFGRDLLRAWLGNDFAVKGGLVFQILSFGMLLNALSQIPANLLDSIGRPDMRAKVFLSYVLVYAGLLWFLISRFGIVGAALAWTLRGALECLLFLATAAKLLRIGPATFAGDGLLRGVIVYSGFALAASASRFLSGQGVVQGGMTLLCLLLFALCGWKYALDDRERTSFSLAAVRLRNRG
ncbi:MAG TPA: flippase [bacterium]|nr:flippase [bacterium]